MKLKKLFLAAGLTAAATVSVTAQKAPEPCDLTPSARQIEWYNREMIAFFHFGINTFEDLSTKETERHLQPYSILPH